MAQACGEALGSEQEMLNDWSTWVIADRYGEALGLEQERIKCRSTEDLLHAHFIVSCSNPSASSHLVAISHVL